MSAVRGWLSETRQQIVSRVAPRPLSLGDRKIASFCFDDFPRSALTTAGSILADHGVRGTYYAAPGLAGTHNELGEQFLADDLHTLLADGHELGCHTYSHLSCRAAGLREFVEDAERGRRELRALTGRDPVNFAYPYGHVTVKTKMSLGKRMESCRGIFSGVNGPRADLHLLRANSLYGDVDQLLKVRRLLDENDRPGTWVIFYTHDVRREHSPFGCTPVLFERAVALVLQAGFTIATVGEVIGTAAGAGSAARIQEEIWPAGTQESENQESESQESLQG